MSVPKKHIIIGMSGGVDSSVAALLLKKEGHHVEGVFMKNWEAETGNPICPAVQDVQDAEAVCNQLKIPLHTVNFADSYWKNVFEHFLSEYEQGRTPNPDILCNREIKFKLFIQYAKSLGADYIATGHYACIAQKENTSQNAPVFELHKAQDLAKDQSYFLYTLNQDALSKSLFPLSGLSKTMVRKLAKESGFLNHQKKDSTGICFIGEQKFNPFLKRYLKATPGPILTPEGEKLGEHPGLIFFTIGQRQGLNIGGRANSLNAPWYVLDKDLRNHALIVGQGHNHPLLFNTTLKARNLHWINEPPNHDSPYQAKIRYRQMDQACRIKLVEDYCEVSFTQPQRAITKGQAIVFYQGEQCLGGGTIA